MIKKWEKGKYLCIFSNIIQFILISFMVILLKNKLEILEHKTIEMIRYISNILKFITDSYACFILIRAA